MTLHRLVFTTIPALMVFALAAFTALPAWSADPADSDAGLSARERFYQKYKSRLPADPADRDADASSDREKQREERKKAIEQRREEMRRQRVESREMRKEKLKPGTTACRARPRL